MIFTNKAVKALLISAVVSATMLPNVQANTKLRGRNTDEATTTTTTTTTTTSHNGRKLANFETRIVGGSNANEGEYPFFVHWDGGCGASLIHDDLVLTAAHCDSPGGGSVIVGAYRNGQSGGDAVKLSVVAKSMHPSYDDNAETPTFDFMVLKLAQPVSNKPIRLNRSINAPADGKDLTVIGFGATSEGGSGSQILQEVIVKSDSQQTCASQYGSDIRQDVHLCASVPGGGKDSCQGDSGGPIFEFQNGEPVQVGVVSFGNGCARPNFAGVYARVSGVTSWIDQQICDMTSVNRPASCGAPTTPTPTLAPRPAPAPSAGGSPTGGESPTGGQSPTGGESPTAGSPSAGGAPSAGDNLAPSAGGGESPTAGSPSAGGGDGAPTPTFGAGGGGTPTELSPSSPVWWWDRRTKEETKNDV